MKFSPGKGVFVCGNARSWGAGQISPMKRTWWQRNTGDAPCGSMHSHVWEGDDWGLKIGASPRGTFVTSLVALKPLIPLSQRPVVVSNFSPTAKVLLRSVKTADSHGTRLIQKLDIHETASLVRYAVQHGLVQP